MMFWSELAKPAPSLTVLDSIGTMYESSVQNAELSFESMMRVCPNSAEVLRSYAQYLLEVCVCAGTADDQLGSGSSC